MKKCIVIGGGLAGLTSAAYLSDNKVNVEIIEASPKPGGRAYSFKDNDTGTIIDNGQHIMMGCYKDTLKFFNLIGAGNNLILQDRISVSFVKENFNIFPLKASGLPYPVNLLSALLNYKAISISDRLKFLRFFLKLPFVLEKDLKNLSVHDWLVNENQNENIIKAFWEILAVGALNTNIKDASAATFAIILKEMFLKGNKAASIIIPKYGLSETYCESAVRFIKQRNGKINLGEQVKSIKYSNNTIYEIETNAGKITDFDVLISAIPPYAFNKIFYGLTTGSSINFEYSPIISIHIWLKDNPLKELFYGLINSPVHWIFNHKDHITLVISDAAWLLNMPNEELFKTAARELRKYVLIQEEKITSFKIIKEKRATFIPSKEILMNRPGQITSYDNFFIAGDWVNTGLPSTIESAVKSGRIAAELVLQHI